MHILHVVLFIHKIFDLICTWEHELTQIKTQNDGTLMSIQQPLTGVNTSKLICTFYFQAV